MSNCETWALPIVKRRLLAGEHVDQHSMLEETNGTAWRLGAAIYYLSSRGWDISRYDQPNGSRAYYLTHSEIQRIKAEGAKNDG